MDTKIERGVVMVKTYDGWHRADEFKPRIFFFSVQRFAPGMTREELEREIESAESCFAMCEECGQGISTKETVRYNDCRAAHIALLNRS
jgi:hypothetical protein